jgi:hypothetical protein
MANEDAAMPSFSVDSQRLLPNLDRNDSVEASRRIDMPLPGTWIGWLERKRGLIGSMLGGRRRGIQASVAQAIHQILTGSPVVREVRWHFRRDFDSGVERGTSSPLTPA